MKSDYRKPEGYSENVKKSAAREIKELLEFLPDSGIPMSLDKEAVENGKSGFSRTTMNTYRELIHALAVHRINSARLCQIVNKISMYC